eukprot:1445388-Pyramimonas_sp.AAC.1
MKVNRDRALVRPRDEVARVRASGARIPVQRMIAQELAEGSLGKSRLTGRRAEATEAVTEAVQHLSL